MPTRLPCQFPLPALSPTAYVQFNNGLPSHYLMMMVMDPSIRGEDREYAFYHACHGVLKELQTRVMGVRGMTEPGSLFPEARTYEPWGQHFQYEFWWQSQSINIPTTPDCWDIDALVAAIDPDWLGKAIKERMAQY